MEISVKGRMQPVPAVTIGNQKVIVRGHWLKIAVIPSEPFCEGEVVPDPELFIARLKQWDVKPDLFRFAQKITDPEPKFNYRLEWDNFAVLPITTYEDWLKNQAKKDVKENLRRAKREGVEVRVCEYNDEFVRGIKSLYDETPIRQGRPFWHYNKAFEKVKRENGTFLDRSEYIGAFFENELIGFIKMVYIGNIAKTMQVISKDRYFSKRPTNALLAKAVEVCAAKGIKYFNYGQYEYPGKKDNTLTDFKSRHGFVRINFPRYFVPLTLKGKLYLAAGFHLGFKRFIPTRLLATMLKTRATFRRYFSPEKKIS